MAAEPTRRFVTPEGGEAPSPSSAPPSAPPSPPAPSALRDQAPPADAVPDSGKALAVYLLHLGGFLTSGLTNLVAVILAYVFRDGADPVTRSHLTNGATIFWGALLFNLVAFALTGTGIAVISTLGFAALGELEANLPEGLSALGPVALLALGGLLLSFYAFVWFLVRTIKGLVLLNDRKVYPNPGSWGF